MNRLISALVLSLFLLTGDPACPKSQRQTATLVEVHAIPGCAGLDCPPWPMPTDVVVCLKIDQTYYTGAYLPWGVPWATAGKRLLQLKGQSVEVIVKDKEIRVVAPKINARLRRTHKYQAFSIASCNET
jgi:hypothetical protein